MSLSTAGTAVGRNWQRTRVLLALLAISAALNLFFIGGALWTRLHPLPAAQSFDDRFQAMADQLALDPQQRAAFDRFAAAMRLHRQEMRRQVAPLMDAARQEMGKPQADPKQVFALLDQVSAKRHEFQHDAVAQTLAFLATLSPDQRSKFVAITRERWPAAHGPEH